MHCILNLCAACWKPLKLKCFRSLLSEVISETLAKLLCLGFACHIVQVSRLCIFIPRSILLTALSLRILFVIYPSVFGPLIE